jgi:hypothetical protein
MLRKRKTIVKAEEKGRRQAERFIEAASAAELEALAAITERLAGAQDELHEWVVHRAGYSLLDREEWVDEVRVQALLDRLVAPAGLRLLEARAREDPGHILHALVCGELPDIGSEAGES